MKKFKAKILNTTEIKLNLEKYGFIVDEKNSSPFYHCKYISSLEEKEDQLIPFVYLTKNKSIVNNEDIFHLEDSLEDSLDFAFSKLDESYLDKYKGMGPRGVTFIENNLIKNFKEVAKNDLSNLKEKLDSEDLEGVKSVCHKMKSSFSTLGLIKTTNMLNDYHKTAKDFSEYDYFNLVRNYESDCLFLDEYLNKIKG